MDPGAELAPGTKERASLGLDDPPDLTAASPASLALAVINAVHVLVAAVLVKGVAIGAVGKGRSLVADRFA
jgi:hypothetical protein